MNFSIGRINKLHQIQQKNMSEILLPGLEVLSFTLQARSNSWIYMLKLLWEQVTVSLFSFKTQLEDAARVRAWPSQCPTDLSLA